MRFKHAEINIPNIEYSELNYDMQDLIGDNLQYPIKDGYDNYNDVEINVSLDGAEDYYSDYFLSDLKTICDLTDKEFKKALKDGEELTFYVSYEL